MSTSDKLLAELKHLHPRLIDLSLGRIERLLAKLGDPHKSLPPVIPHRRHQWQRLRVGIFEGDAGGGGSTRSRLCFSAPGPVS